MCEKSEIQELAGLAPSGASQGTYLFLNFWWDRQPLVFFGLLMFHSSLCHNLTHAFFLVSYICVQISPLSMRTPVILDLEPTLTQSDHIITWWMQRHYFQIKSCPQGSAWTWTWHGWRLCMLSHFGRVQLFETPWTVTCQDPLSMGFSRQEYWSGLSCPPPEALPDPGTELVSRAERYYSSQYRYL